MSYNKYLNKAIIASARCQRNWDLSKTIPEEDMKVIEAAIAHSPSKQNRVFFKALIITDRDKIEAIHSHTKGFGMIGTGDTTTNSQTLANVLIAFIRDDDGNHMRTKEERELGKVARKPRDEDRAVGVTAGYVSLVAEMLGLRSGCCQCMHGSEIKEILGGDPLLLMGIGYPDLNRSRLEHHSNPDFSFPSFKKDVKIEYDI